MTAASHKPRRPRTPEHWPKMKHRAAARLARHQIDVVVSIDLRQITAALVDAASAAANTIVTFAERFINGIADWQKHIIRYNDAVTYAKTIVADQDELDTLIREAIAYARNDPMDVATAIRLFADQVNRTHETRVGRIGRRWAVECTCGWLPTFLEHSGRRACERAGREHEALMRWGVTR